MKTRRRAFTLIELLTVIAIIGILAAILIPTVGAVRMAAKESQSLSNLRQIALALNLYADEHKDRFPIGYDDGKDDVWTKHIGPYIGVKSPLLSAADNVFVSPLATVPFTNVDAGSYIPCTYSVHGLLCADTTVEDGRMPRTQVLRPSRVILVGEGTQRANAYAGAYFSKPTAFYTKGASNNLADLIPTDTDEDGVNGALRYRGRSGAPVGFVDGHVQTLKKGTVTYGHVIADR